MDLFEVNLKYILMPDVLERILFSKPKGTSNDLKHILKFKSESRYKFYRKVYKYIYQTQKNIPNFLYLGLSRKANWVKNYEPVEFERNALLRLLTYTSPLEINFYLKNLNKNQFYKYIDYNLTITYKIFQGYIALLETKNSHKTITKNFELESYNENLKENTYSNFVTKDKKQQNELNQLLKQYFSLLKRKPIYI